MALGLSPAPRIYPPATEEQIAAEEQALDFALPSLYRQILTEVGNGGFGPGYGLIGVQDGYTGMTVGSLAETYLSFRREGPDGSGHTWPERVLVVCTWGCGIYSCLDCADAAAPVLVYDPGLHVLDGGIVEATLTNAEGEVVWQYIPDEDERREARQPARPRVEMLPHVDSLVAWLAAWADGVDLWADMERLS
jgi:hypothetical protein